MNFDIPPTSATSESQEQLNENLTYWTDRRCCFAVVAGSVYALTLLAVDEVFD